LFFALSSRRRNIGEAITAVLFFTKTMMQMQACVRYQGKMEIIAVPKTKGSWIDTSSVVDPRGGEVNSERMKHP
jgi:hypothetical protein